MEKLIIPKKINVGFQNRSDTYTGKLAYIIYWDSKNVLRKQTSWDGWRDKNIPNQEFNNEPTEGFVLNKKVGDYKSDWNHRMAHIRVYDPRNFEFEISVENLLYILSETNCDKGKGLDGKFVYAWDGKELVLLPCSSSDYKKSSDFTDLQSMKITKNDMVIGCQYTFKDNVSGIYLGRLKRYIFSYVDTDDVYYQYDSGKTYSPNNIIPILEHVFKLDDGNYRFESGFTKIAKRNTDIVYDDLASLLVEYESTIYGGKIVGYEVGEEITIDFNLTDEEFTQKYYYEHHDFNIINPDGSIDHFDYLYCGGLFYYYHKNYDPKNPNAKRYYITHLNKYNLVFDNNELVKFTKKYLNSDDNYTREELENKKLHKVYALLENGSKVSLNNYLNNKK
jgi:hypothetical protein